MAFLADSLEDFFLQKKNSMNAGGGGGSYDHSGPTTIKITFFGDFPIIVFIITRLIDSIIAG